MGFAVSRSTLEALEWGRILGELRALCRTPQGRLRLAEGSDTALFETQEAEVRARLRETSEARTLLDHESPPPLGGCRDVSTALSLAEKGGVLEAPVLLDVRSSIEALDETRRFLEARAATTPALAELAHGVESQASLAAEIGRCLDAGGEVRDAASATLASARREVQRLGSELKSRIERALGHPDVAPHLSDRYYTVRSGRFVLPVKADAKGQVRGIVHDASRSGTTLFVEPDAMTELNNRHRQAELAVEREVLRVLRDLSAAVAREAETLRKSLARAGEIDLAFARGELSRRQEGVEPALERNGVFELAGLRHPLIPAEECVANDLRLGRDFSVLILSGPNAGGKTVALKSIALAALGVRAGLHVPANPGARVALVDRVLADIGDHQDIQESLSTFSAAMASLAGILREAGPHTLVCLDEVGVGTDPSEGAAIAQSTLEALAESGARTVTTTHYNLLKEMAEVDARFENASVEFDPETLAPTYRVRIGSPGSSSAATVAARMGMPTSVLERAAALLDHEDRRLDRMLAELSASRALLEAEKSAAEAARIEGEQAREHYRGKLARLQERRDKLFEEMRRDLDAAFREAHGEVARVIRELQRAPSSRRAARARDELETIRERNEATQPAHDPSSPVRGDEPAAGPAVDWPKAKVGDPVRTPSGAQGTLLSMPDRRGRVAVRVGSAKLRIDRDQLRSAIGAEAPQGSATRGPRGGEQEPAQGARGGCLEVDLRGMRVDEALERLEQQLDVALAQGRDEVRVIHGIGTGALRKAVREWLPHSPYVARACEADREEGGPGATRAILQES